VGGIRFLFLYVVAKWVS